MSEQVTAKRIWAARTARRFPVILEMVERGELHLSAIHALARHLTPENCSEVLGRARHKSSREIERLVAALAPRPDVASSIRTLPTAVVGAAQSGGGSAAASHGAAAASDGATTCSEAASDCAAAAADDATTRSEAASATTAAIQSCPVQLQGGSPIQATTAKPITALSPRRYKIEITVDEATHDKLRSLQDLLGRSEVGRDPAAIISRAIDVLLADTLKRKAGTTDRPRPVSPPRTAREETTRSQRPAASPLRCGESSGFVTADAAATWTVAGIAATRPATSSFTTRIRSRGEDATTRTTSSCAARPTTSTRPISTSAAPSWTPGAAPARTRHIPRGMSPPGRTRHIPRGMLRPARPRHIPRGMSRSVGRCR